MYNTYAGGCNVLSLQLSRHKTIDVKSNTNKSWDYTNPLLPVVESRMGNGNNDGHGNGHHNMMGGPGGVMGQNSNMNKNNMMADHPLLPMPMNMAAATAAAMAAAAVAASGHHFNNSQSPFMSNHHQPHHNQHQNPSVQNGQGNSNNPYAAAAAAAVAAQSGYPMPPMDGRSAVVQVSNFPDQVFS